MDIGSNLLLQLMTNELMTDVAIPISTLKDVYSNLHIWRIDLHEEVWPLLLEQLLSVLLSLPLFVIKFKPFPVVDVQFSVIIHPK